MAPRTARNSRSNAWCPKLGIEVCGTGGSRRAGEQAAAKLALEAAQQALAAQRRAKRKAAESEVERSPPAVENLASNLPAESVAGD